MTNSRKEWNVIFNGTVNSNNDNVDSPPSKYKLADTMTSDIMLH